MNNDKNIKLLIDKLNIMLGVGGSKPSVSPTSRSGGDRLSLPDTIHISTNMELEKLTKDQLVLTHTLLHRFYASGHKILTRKDIEQLHSKIKDKVNHFVFDKLDR